MLFAIKTSFTARLIQVAHQKPAINIKHPKLVFYVEWSTRDQDSKPGAMYLQIKMSHAFTGTIRNLESRDLPAVRSIIELHWGGEELKERFMQ